MVKATKGALSPCSVNPIELTFPFPRRRPRHLVRLPLLPPCRLKPIWRVPADSDPAVKQILLQLDENAGRQRFIIADLDETHVLISPDSVERVKEVRLIFW